MTTKRVPPMSIEGEKRKFNKNDTREFGAFPPSDVVIQMKWCSPPPRVVCFDPDFFEA